MKCEQNAWLRYSVRTGFPGTPVKPVHPLSPYEDRKDIKTNTYMQSDKTYICNLMKPTTNSYLITSFKIVEKLSEKQKLRSIVFLI